MDVPTIIEKVSCGRIAEDAVLIERFSRIVDSLVPEDKVMNELVVTTTALETEFGVILELFGQIHQHCVRKTSTILPVLRKVLTTANVATDIEDVLL